MNNRLPSRRLLLGFLLLLPLVSCGRAGQPAGKSNVFDMPRVHAEYVQIQAQVPRLLRLKAYDQAATLCRRAADLIPTEPISYYNLACCQVHQGKLDDAIATLHKAIDRGFNDTKLLNSDADLNPLREREEFAALTDKAAVAKPKPSPLLNIDAKPALVKDGVALVSEANTSWNPRLAVFQSSFKFERSAERQKPLPITNKRDEAGKLLYNWFIAGTAAGLEGHLYDNHDGDHSNMRYGRFPQLTRVEYDDQVRRRKLHSGLQLNFFFNTITIGNSSTALTGGPYWRSQSRLAVSSQRRAALLYLQYVRNHIYVYPEHRDHDADGSGDVYFANTPYLVTSQGSSGSDRVFLDALTASLAAFHPEAKKKLADKGALMAALQMVFRMSNKQVVSPEDYLTGKAHPSVFQGKQLDELRMIKLAHQIQPDNVPPVVQLRVVKEDQSVLGIDYFEAGAAEKAITTPAAICRIMRSMKYERRMVLSAQPSHDLNNLPLTYHWRVLRGDSQRITIKPLNKEKSLVEVVVPYHERRPVESDSELMTNRVDIGAFVHNGHYYSAPAFVSFYTLHGEVRKYNKRQQIESVEYLPTQKRYFDPVLGRPRVWRDDYRYDEQHRLLGWTRSRGDKREEFTPQGALVIAKDAEGRPTQARTVRYVGASRQGKGPGELIQKLGNEILHYGYESKEDKIGRVVQRTAAGSL